MNQIKLNDTLFEIDSYNRTTYFSGDTLSSNASCSLVSPTIADINELIGDKIEQLQIYHDNNLIYDLQDIDAKLDSVNEYLNGDRVNVGLNFVFNMGDVNENNNGIV